MIRPRFRSAFTLTELLVALAVGMVVVQIAFASFFIVRKYVNRIQRLEAATNLVQAAVTWYGFNSTTALPNELKWVPGVDYPGINWDAPSAIGTEKARSMPQRIVCNIDETTGVLKMYDLSRDAQAAKDRNEQRGITGYLASPADPRILAEIQLQ